ncbi:MAG: preprotein translocase subunit YajC [Gaiellaceae bacterium]
MAFLLVIVVVLALVWLLLVRPQRRRQLQHTNLLERLAIGDEVLTAGGLYGRIREIAGEEVTLEIAPGTEVKLDKRAIAGVVEPEEEAELEMSNPPDES